MELRNNQNADLSPASRYADIRHVTETRNAEIRETVELVHKTVEDRREQAEKIGKKADSIELSDAAKDVVDDTTADREERIEELRDAARDGSLFDRDRLARAAERLLGE